MNKYKVVVFEQHGSGEHKISGIREFGRDIEIAAVFDIEAALPEFIDDPERYVTTDFFGDLVLDFLRHPDLSEYLAEICLDKDVPVIASGKKTRGAITPFTCCGLGRIGGRYAEQFGLPELDVEVENGRISRIMVRRGAPCGATWHVIPKIIGLTPEEALATLAREVQYLCKADPRAFDPVSSKSPLHYAGNVHIAALKKALTK